MRKHLAAVALAATGVIAPALPAGAHTHALTLPSASHDHQDLGGGRVEGATWHPLHCLVHIGTPGTFAFDHEGNPVDIFKVGTFTGSCASKPGSGTSR